MASLDIFNDDAFSVTSMIGTITDIPRVPSRLRSLFSETGMTTTTAFIERQGGGLKLVPSAPRGGVGAAAGREGRKLIPVASIHLPQRDTILADEVQGVRAFGSETEVQSVQGLVRRQLAQLKEQLDLTIEHLCVGAIRGKVLDSDGVSEIYDVYTLFGMNQTTLPFNINTANSSVDLKGKVIDLKRRVQAKLGGRRMTRVRVICSESWFDKFVGHDKMVKYWERWQDGAFNRQDQSVSDFEYAGVVFEVYSGTLDNYPFIPDNEAFAFPEGVSGMLQIKYAPADYMETVNTLGLPYYAKQEVMRFGKGVEIESQSNPLVLNTLPEATFKLTTAAS